MRPDPIAVRTAAAVLMNMLFSDNALPYKAHGEAVKLMLDHLAESTIAALPQSEEPADEGFREALARQISVACDDDLVRDEHFEVADAVLPLIAAREAALRADYETVLASHRKLVREIDVTLNGEAGAAKQASLCDLVGQITDLAAAREWIAKQAQDIITLGQMVGKAEAERDAARAALTELINMAEKVRIFVNSKERIKQPEGADFFEEALRRARAATRGKK